MGKPETTDEQVLSILIVDDHAVIASAMAMALKANGFSKVVVLDSNDFSLEAVVTRARLHKADVVLLDLYLGQDRLSLPMITPLIEHGVRVVLFTSSTDSRLLTAALYKGVEAVLDKAASFDKVLEALNNLAAGRSLLSPDERRTMIESLERDFKDEDERKLPFERLTAREAEVLQRLIDGDAPKQIAFRDGISVSTVRGHIERIFQKLDVSSQREALALARVVGWPGENSDLADLS